MGLPFNFPFLSVPLLLIWLTAYEEQPRTSNILCMWGHQLGSWLHESFLHLSLVACHDTHSVSCFQKTNSWTYNLTISLRFLGTCKSYLYFSFQGVSVPSCTADGQMIRVGLVPWRACYTISSLSCWLPSRFCHSILGYGIAYPSLGFGTLASSLPVMPLYRVRRSSVGNASVYCQRQPRVRLSARIPGRFLPQLPALRRWRGTSATGEGWMYCMNVCAIK
jgi:hypothetical protein